MRPHLGRSGLRQIASLRAASDPQLPSMCSVNRIIRTRMLEASVDRLKSMNPYILLTGAILLEVAGTTAMKSSEGFSKLVPSIMCGICYVISFYLLAQTLKNIPTGIAYAIWSGVGILLISVIAWIFHGQRLDWGAIFGIFLIVCGVIAISLFSSAAEH